MIGICLLLVVVVIGIIGFRYLEGFDPFEAFYVTAVTIISVGYRDIVPETPTGKISAAGLILSGVGIAKVKRNVAKMKNHMIICGGGRCNKGCDFDRCRRGTSFWMVSTLPSDSDDLFPCITAKELNKDLEMVTRASSKEAAKGCTALA